jgi:hypothetical protein
LNRCPGASGRAVSIEILIYVMRATRRINYRNERDMEVDTPKNATVFNGSRQSRDRMGEASTQAFWLRACMT